MNFFEEQARARRQSRALLLVFLCAMLLVAIAVMLLMALVLFVGSSRTGQSLGGMLSEHGGRVLMGGLVILAIMGIASVYKIARLKSGGGSIAAQLGATAVPSGTSIPQYRRLRNVVEEIAIASGVPVPQVFVLEMEPGINAFAAGYSPSDAAITVTRGALDKLTRDELQGVVAHEFSHILNGDMRLNIRLMGLLFGLLVIHIIGREVLDHSPRGSKRGPTIALLGFGLLILGWMGLMLGRMIKAGISRQREFLADASAVQFTRQADGIAGALQKAAGIHEGSQLQFVDGEEVSHMLFGEGFSQSAWFATHPPVMQRILRLQPQFTETQLRVKSKLWNAPDFHIDAADESPVLALASAEPHANGAPPAAPAVVAQVGHPGLADYQRAEFLSLQLPALLREPAEHPGTVTSLLLALLLTDTAANDAELVQRCQQKIAESEGQACADAVAALRGPMNLMEKSLRLPLASVAFAALRQRPEPELRRLQGLVEWLTLADDVVGPFQFALGHLLRVQLDDWFSPSSTPAKRLKLDACRSEIAGLLTLLAVVGTDDPVTAERALAKAWSLLFGLDPTPRQKPSDYAELHRALIKLDALLPFGKQAVIEAMVQVLGFDGRFTIGEAELLRVVCASLHCPLPPVLGRHLA